MTQMKVSTAGEGSSMISHDMKHYPGIIQARLSRLRHIAESMHRSAVWTSSHDLARPTTSKPIKS